MDELKPCPFCGNTKIGVVRSKYKGVPFGDDGWCAEIKCKCGADMKFWAFKKSWVEKPQLKHGIGELIIRLIDADAYKALY